MPHLRWDFLNLKPLCNHSFCLHNGQVIPSYLISGFWSALSGTIAHICHYCHHWCSKVDKFRSVRNQSSFLPLVHFTEEKGWISVTSVVIRDDYPGYENILSCFFLNFFRLYVNIKVNFDFVPVEVNFSG